MHKTHVVQVYNSKGKAFKTRRSITSKTTFTTEIEIFALFQAKWKILSSFILRQFWRPFHAPVRLIQSTL
jgi:hypothetical protein